jgi:hypothetical protein
MKLSEISFPVFRLTNRKPDEIDGVVFYQTESFNADTAQLTTRIRIIDDKTLPFDHLSRRRLALKGIPSVSLYPINKAVYFLADLIKLAKNGYWWIDSLGRTFEYKKHKFGKVTFHKIEAAYALPGMGAVIALEGVPNRFKVLFRPSELVRYGGILHIGPGERILYGLYEDLPPNSRRKV